MADHIVNAHKVADAIAYVNVEEYVGGYLINRIPTAMAQMARKTELCNIFIYVIILILRCKFTKSL